MKESGKTQWQVWISKITLISDNDMVGRILTSDLVPLDVGVFGGDKLSSSSSLKTIFGPLFLKPANLSSSLLVLEWTISDDKPKSFSEV